MSSQQDTQARADVGSQYTPRPYQATAVEQVVARYERGQRKMLLHLPTGSGKTVIAALIIERLLARDGQTRSKVLFVAHRKELLDQTAATLRRQIPHVSISIEQGRRTADMSADVIIASIQSLARRKHAYPTEQFSAIICDECHRALAPRWLAVIEHFHHQRAGETLLLGMTATPRRTDGRSAVALFDTVAYAISKAELQDLGYLVPVHYWSIRADLHLDRVKLAGSDFQVSALSKTMNTVDNRALTLAAWEARGSRRKTLGFCASVAHAHQLAADFTSAGYRAAVVDGRTRNRDALLAQFRGGQLDVLFNYGVLVEGFDDPAIECLLMARPTTSPLVYEQCMGRGLRPHAGKSACTVIDIVDRATHHLQYNACSLAGLPKRWQSGGRDPFREARSLRGVRVTDTDAFAAIRAAQSLEQVQDLLISLPPEVVVAGLDGEPVPRYEPIAEDATPMRGKVELRRLLAQAGAVVKRIDVAAPSEDEPITRARVKLLTPELDNERFDYLRWHLERATGWRVAYIEPATVRSRAPSPRALLRSLLPEGQRVVKFALARGNRIVAEVSGMQTEHMERICREFEAATGLALDLRGQLSFGFTM